MMAPRDQRKATDAVANSVTSYADVYDAHVDEVYRFVHRRCRDHALAEDVTQETFVTAIRRAEGPDSVSIGWLITVARNRLLDVLRRQGRYQDKLRLVGGAPPSPGHEADTAERLRVERALSELSADHRLVLTLHYLDGLTVPALAEQLGRSPKSVEGLVTRARRELREKLGDVDGTRADGGRHV